MISYFLYLNKLTKALHDYAARVVNVPVYTLEDIIQRATQEGKTMTEEEMRSAYSSMEKAMIDIIGSGGSVQLSILSTAFSIKGVFDSDEESFTEGKHKLNLKMYPGDSLVKAAQRNRLKRVKAGGYSPEPTKVEDVASQSINELLTPGNMACLKGENIKFDAGQADEGLFLLNGQNKETKVAHIARNMPSELVFLVPAQLAKGTYWIEVRNRGYQELTTGRLKHPLTVK